MPQGTDHTTLRSGGEALADGKHFALLALDVPQLSPERHTFFNNVAARLGRAAHTAAAVAAAFHATWFSLQYDDELTQYTKVVLPGDPKADILFTIVIK